MEPSWLVRITLQTAGVTLLHVDQQQRLGKYGLGRVLDILQCKDSIRNCKYVYQKRYITLTRTERGLEGRRYELLTREQLIYNEIPKLTGLSKVKVSRNRPRWPKGFQVD